MTRYMMAALAATMVLSGCVSTTTERRVVTSVAPLGDGRWMVERCKLEIVEGALNGVADSLALVDCKETKVDNE